MTEQPPATTSIQSSKPNRLRVLRMALLLLLAVGGGLAVQRAWQATKLREAYISELVAATKTDAKNSRLWTVLGARLAQSGYYDQAAWALHNAVQNGNHDPLCWKTLASLVAASGRAAQAQKVLQLGIQMGVPGLSEALQRMQQVPATARPAQLGAAIIEGPTPLVDSITAGSFLNPLSEWWGRHHPEASGFATREAWVNQEPRNAEAQRLWGEALLRNRALAKAVATLEIALTLAPDSVPTHRDMAEAATLLGRLDRAVQEYQICLKLRPNWTPALLALAGVQLQQGQVVPATQSYERATQLDPQSVEAWIGLGKADLQWSSRGADALNAFVKAAQLAPERTDFYDDYAESLRLRYQLDDAEKVLRRRLQAAPDDAHAHYLLGYLLWRNRPDAKRQQEAEAELQLALKYGPGQPQFQLELAQLLLRTGKPQAALPLLRQVTAQDGLNATAIRLLAEALRQSGQVAAARAATERADKLTRVVEQLQVLTHLTQGTAGDAKIYRQLAKLYASVGQTAKAQEAMRQANQVSQHGG
ncbi:MAG: tetratricopeptide repeat protein [Abitibacteriaceae bacterium]|nr:tetratricopeptide repeat protein [Abditibacteriaceae bacterium]MBV9866062.1 tetratricopeptide repeat protein [Abditibacteriaceae bacterium]